MWSTPPEFEKRKPSLTLALMFAENDFVFVDGKKKIFSKIRPALVLQSEEGDHWARSIPTAIKDHVVLGENLIKGSSGLACWGVIKKWNVPEPWRITTRSDERKRRRTKTGGARRKTLRWEKPGEERKGKKVSGRQTKAALGLAWDMGGGGLQGRGRSFRKSETCVGGPRERGLVREKGSSF